jgi:hypothetical protein
VGSPGYLKSRARPKLPRDLLRHRCINFRHGDAGLYRWEFEKGQKILICRSERSIGRRRSGPGYPCCNRRRRPRLHVGRRCSTALYEWRTGPSAGRLVPTFPRLLSLLSEPAATVGRSFGFDQCTAVVAATDLGPDKNRRTPQLTGGILRGVLVNLTTFHILLTAL